MRNESRQVGWGPAFAFQGGRNILPYPHPHITPPPPLPVCCCAHACSIPVFMAGTSSFTGFPLYLPTTFAAAGENRISSCPPTWDVTLFICSIPSSTFSLPLFPSCAFLVQPCAHFAVFLIGMGFLCLLYACHIAGTGACLLPTLPLLPLPTSPPTPTLPFASSSARQFCSIQYSFLYGRRLLHFHGW